MDLKVGDKVSFHDGKIMLDDWGDPHVSPTKPAPSVP
jgi:hypothetical protein